MSRKNIFKTTLLFSAISLILFNNIAFATQRVSNGSGAWLTTTIWTPNGTPAAGDTINIASGHTITMNGNSGSCNRLIIDGTATWANAYTTAVGAGGVVINATGDIAGTVAGILTTTGGLTINNTLTSNTVGITILTTAGQTIAGTGSLAILTVSATATNIGTLTVRTTLAGASTLTNTGTLYIGAASVTPTLSATAAGNYVIYNSTTQAQTVKNTTYYHLTIDKSGQTATLGGTTTVNGNLLVNAGTLSDGSYQITGNATGTLTVASGATLQIGTAAATTFPTLFTAPNIILTGSTVIYGATATQAISLTPTYNNLTLNGASTKTANGALTINGNLTVNAGTLADGGFTITGGGTLSVAAGATLTLGTTTVATSFPTSFGTITLNTTSTVNYNSNVAQTISSVPFYGNLTLTATGAVIKTLGGSVIVANNLTIGVNNTLNLNGLTLSIAGTYSNSGTLNASAASSTIQLNGTAAQIFTVGTYTGSLINTLIIDNSFTTGVTVSATLNVGTLTINPSRTLTMGAVTLSVSGNITNNGTFNGDVASSVLNLNGTSLQTISGSGTYTNNRIRGLMINNPAGVDLQQNLTIYTALTLTAGALSSSVKSTFTLGIGSASTLTTSRTNGSLALTPTFNLTSVTYNVSYGAATGAITTGNELPTSPTAISGTLTINNASGVVLDRSITVGGVLTLTSGAFSIGANVLTLNNTISGSGTLTGGTSSDIVFGTYTAGTTLPAVSGGLQNLTVNRASYIITLGATITIWNNLTVNNGTLYDGGYQITGNATGTLTVASGATLQLGYGGPASSFPTIFTNIILTGSTVIYGASVSQTISSVPFYHNLTLSGTTIRTANGAITINNNFMISAGSIDCGGYIISVKGNITNNGAQAGIGRILLSGGGATHTISGTGSYVLLELDDTYGATMAGSFTIGGTLILTSGVYTIGANTLFMNGSFSIGSGSITGGTTSNLTVAGALSQLSLPTILNGLNNLTMNRATGMILTAPLTLGSSGILTLTSGIVTTTATNLLTLSNTATGAVSGGGTSSYVNGPMARTLPASLVTGSTYAFPVGKSAYKLIRLVNPTTTSGGSVVISSEVFDGNSNGSAGNGFSSIRTDRYWKVEITSGSGNFTNTTLKLAEATLVPYNRIGKSATQTGSYDTIGGMTSGDSVITSSTIASFSYFVIGSSSPISGSRTIGTGGDFTTLKGFFDYVNGSILNGPLTGNIISALTEASSAVLNAVNYSGGPWQILITSSGGSWVVSGAIAGPLVDLNGANYIVFDGLSKTLTFRNTSTSGQTFRFINDACNDTIRGCIIEGCNVNATSSTIVFGTAGTGSGNDNNVIAGCDIKDVTGTGTPANGIYATGTSGKENSNILISNCNIYNYYHGTVASNGILIPSSSYNTDWTISGNSFYQTSSRAPTGGVDHSAIRVDLSTNGNNFRVIGNYIGGTLPNCNGTAYTVTGTGAIKFYGIYLNVGYTTASSIQGNTIKNISWTNSGIATGIFFGITVPLNGAVNIGNETGNVIGSTTGNGSITVQAGSSGAITYGIYNNSSNGAINISNNTIGSITVQGSATTISHSFVGISIGAGDGSTRIISNNLIGSLTTPNSINAITSSTSATSQYVTGITNTTGTSALQITNNTIANLNNNYASTATAGQIQGIYTPFGIMTITGNTIRNLSTTSQNAGTGSSASAIGICFTAASYSGQVISQNVIYSLTNSAVSAAVNVIGIHYNGVASGTNLIARNFIHNIGLITTSTSATIIGLNITAGVATFQNNMIQLGIDTVGNNITTAYAITGIAKGTANSEKFFFNSIYIGGTGVATTATNTYAFRRTATGTDSVFDNIFVNARSNATTGGKHYGISINATTTFYSNYNNFYVSGTGGVLGYDGTTDRAFLADWRTTLKDSQSVYGNPQFIAPTGNSATCDLHISPVIETPVEALGLNIPLVTDDYDGQTRSSFTPVDIGADAGDFLPLDVIPPTISYNTLTNTHLTDNRTLKARIVDNKKLAVDAGRMPILYFKKNRAGTYYRDSVSTSTNDTFAFFFDHSKLSGVTTGDSIFYYVAAQDTCDNIATSPAGGSGITPPGSNPPTTLNSYLILPTISGARTIGTSGNFTTLKAFFDSINGSVVSGPITGTIISDLTETQSCVLNEVTYDAGGPYPIWIVHDGSSRAVRTISGGIAGALIDFNGVDYITINGLNKSLIFSNTSLTGQTFVFRNDATYDTLMNCIIKGVNSSSSSGTIVISVSTRTTGNDYIVIKNDSIGNGATVPFNAIYSSGTSGRENDNITISNNKIYSFSTYGIRATATGNGGNWFIKGNSFYYSAGTASTEQRCISFIPGTVSNNNTISDNYIGGTASNCGGTAWTNSGYVAIYGIDLSIGSTTATLVRNNTIQNFSMTGTTGGYGGFCGIYSGAGKVNIIKNMVGDSSISNSVVVRMGYFSTVVYPGWIYSIYNASTFPVTIDSNLIANLKTTSADSKIYGIFHEPSSSTGTVSITNNRIFNLTTNSYVNMIYDGMLALGGIYVANSTNNLIENNTVYALRDINTGSYQYGPNNYGIIFTGTNSSGKICRNKIYDLTNTSTTPSGGGFGSIDGIVADEGNYEVSNNMISLTNLPNTNDISMYGIIDYSVSVSSINYYDNSIYLGGTNSGTANSSCCYFRFPGGDGSVAGASVQFRNNIFFNARTGGTTNNTAIANVNSYLTSGWPASASNYNLLVSPDSTKIGRWSSVPGGYKTFAQWKAISGGDNNSISYVSGTSSGQLNATDLFVIPDSNLHIKPTSTVVNRKGTSLSPTVTIDIDGESRHPTKPDIGSDEYAPTAPDVPNLIAPRNDSTNAPQTGQLIWNKTAMADFYDVLLDTLNPPTTKVATFRTDTFYIYSNLLSDKSYYWRVVALNDTSASKGNSTPSSVYHFTTLQVHDVATVAIVRPARNVDSTGTIKPKARFTNLGNYSETFDAVFTIIRGVSVWTSTALVADLDPGEVDSVEFDDPDWTVGVRGNYTARCSTTLYNDINTANDKLDSSFTVIAHDIRVTEILAPIEDIDSASTTIPRARIKNIGNTTETFSVRFMINGPALSRPNFPGSKDGQTITGDGTITSQKLERDEASWYDDTTVTVNGGAYLAIDFIPWTIGPRGNYTTKCSTGLTTDMYHENDTMSSSFAVKVPDVGVLSINVPIGNNDSTASITPQAVVKNYGSDEANFNVRFSITGPSLSRSSLRTNKNNKFSQFNTIDNNRSDIHQTQEGRDEDVWYDDTTVTVGAGNTLVIDFNSWTDGPRGTYTAKCSTGFVVDVYPANDTASAEFKVVVHDVGPISIIAPVGFNDSSATITPQAVVKNFGNDDASFIVKLRIGSWSSTYEVIGLPEGEEELATFAPWTVGPRGSYIVKCSTELANDMYPSNDPLDSLFSVQVKDYAATEISYPTAPVDSGATIQPKAWVYNYGTTDETDVPVTFYIVGTSYSSTKTVSLFAGNSIEQTFDDFVANFPRGSYTMRCTTKLDGDLVVNNNLATSSALIAAHDVGIAEIIAPVGSVDTAATLIPQAKVKNFGNVLDSFNVRFIISGPLSRPNFPSSKDGQATIGDWTSPSQKLERDEDVWYDDSIVTVNAGDSLTIEFASWIIGPRGDYSARCSTALATDKYPANDTISGSFTITANVHDVGVTQIIAPVENIDSTAVLIPEAKVKNYGYQTETFGVKFTIAGPSLSRPAERDEDIWSDDTIVTVGAGDSLLVDFNPWTVSGRGNFSARCSTGLDSDVRPGNDTLAGSFTIKVHDYAATEISFPTNPVDSGTTIQPKAWIHNYGTEPETDVPVKFYIVGTIYTNTKTISLNTGDSIEQVFDDFIADVPRGTYTMRCTTKLDGDLVVNNNLAIDSLLIAAHDVGAAEIIAPTGSVDSAVTLIPQAKVKNFGNVIETFNVRFTITGPSLSRSSLRTNKNNKFSQFNTIDNNRSDIHQTQEGRDEDFWYDDSVVTVNALDSLSIDFTSYSIGPRGNYTTKCSTGLATDIYHENDTISGSFNVIVHDVGVIEIIQPVSKNDSTVTIIPKAVVKNFGNQVETFDAIFTIIGTTTWDNSQLVADLNPGIVDTIEFDPWTIGPRGSYTAKCSTQLATDNNPADDELDSLFTVQVKDYGVSVITVPPDQVDSSATIHPKARIHNYGTTDETDIPVMFYTVGTSYSSTKYVSLNSGNSIEQEFDEFIVNLPRGRYMIRCTTQLTGDLVVDNNLAIDSFDVIVHDVSTIEIIQPIGNIDSTATATPKAKVKNLGTQTETFDVIFSIIGTSVWDNSQLVADLDTNEERIIEFDPWTIVRGSYTTKCSTQLATDNNPSNDKQENSFTVKIKDYSVSSITSPTSPVDSSTTILPKAWIHNYGTNPETDVPVTFYIVGTSYTSTKYVSLTAGSSIEQEFDEFLNALPRGNYTMRCTTQLDGDLLVDNNLATGSFDVIVHDVGTVAILNPSDNFDSTTTIIPRTRVKNYGSETDTFNVKFSIIGPTKAVWFDDTTITLDPDATLNIDFEPWTVGPRGNYTARCSTELATDIKTVNNKQEFSFIVIPIILGWTRLRDITTLTISKGIKDGGSLIVQNDSIYGLQGNNLRSFYVYDSRKDTWYARESLPFRLKSVGHYDLRKVRAGGALTAHNGVIYAFKGGGTNEFWAYNHGQDTWIRRCTIPALAPGSSRGKRVAAGGALVNPAGIDSIYAFKGGSTNEFWVYSINEDTWYPRKPLIPQLPHNSGKKIKAGAALVARADTIYAFIGGSTRYFYAYVPDTWIRKSDANFGNGRDTLKGIGDGAAMTAINNRIYAFKGNNTQIFGYYDLSTKRWYTVPTDYIPQGTNLKKVRTGGSLTTLGNKIYAFKGGNTNEFWCYNPASADLAQVIPSTIRTDMTEKTLTTKGFNFNIAPNPFTKLATIHYSIPISLKVTIKLYNATGRLVETLVDDYQNTGSYSLKIENWKLKISKGVYFLKYEDSVNRAEIKLIIE